MAPARRPTPRPRRQLALLEPRQVRGQICGQLVGSLAQPVAQISGPHRRPSRNSLAGSSSTVVDGANAALVGRIEGAQRLDLVAEPLDAHGQRLAGREDVDDAAAARELAAAGDLGQRLVAKVDQLAQDALLADALARLELHRLVRQLGRSERALEERLDARHEHLRERPSATPREPRRARRTRHGSARSARTRARCAARASRLRPDRRATPAAPLRRDRRSPQSRAIQISRSPLATASAAARNDLGAVRHLRVRDVAQALADAAFLDRPIALGERRDAHRRRRADRSAPTGSGDARAACRVRRVSALAARAAARSATWAAA